MTTQTTAQRRPGADLGGVTSRTSFGGLLRAEWIKFRSVRGWVIGMILAALLMAFIGVFAAANANVGCQINGGPPKSGKACLPQIPHGPGGEVVSDRFYFMHQPLTGNGSITARVTSLTGEHADLTGQPVQAGNGPALVPGFAPWSKAGIIIKQSTRLGSASGLPATVQVGMFATSPNYVVTQNSFGGSSNQAGPSPATGVFDHVSLTAAAAGGTWTGTAIGGGGPFGAGGGGPSPTPFSRAGGTFTVTGSGDIAPVTPGAGSGYPTVTIEQSLAGAFLGLIAIVVVAAMFFTAEYRRGLIRTTLAATPRRGAVLAAKAVVIGAVAFVTGLIASLISIAVGVPKEQNQGQVVLTVPALTEARVIVGTAAVLAVAAVFAVALGAVLRRSAAAITVAVVTVVLPFLLAGLNIVPSGVGAWLLRLTPTAGLAIQQSIPRYPQVTSVLSPVRGYYPLSPYAGFAVLCLWAAGALGLAFVLLRRRDA